MAMEAVYRIGKRLNEVSKFILVILHHSTLGAIGTVIEYTVLLPNEEPLRMPTDYLIIYVILFANIEACLGYLSLKIRSWMDGVDSRLTNQKHTRQVV